MTETKSKRRWFRFSVRTLLVAVTILCIWLGIQVNSAHRQRTAVEGILKAGGTVWFDYQASPNTAGEPGDFTIHADAAPPGPDWLRATMGEDFFRNAISIEITGRIISEETFAQIAKLPRLKTIRIRSTLIGPKETENPTRFGNLGGNLVTPTVKIASTEHGRPINDADLVGFENLTHLTDLHVSDTEIDGSVLKSLGSLRGLKSLVLADSWIDDSGMESIGKMTDLRSLNLNLSRVTDLGLKHLQSLDKLERLWAFDTEICGHGLQFVSPKRLRSLMLRKSHVDDAGMQCISHLANLEELFLDATRITDAGLKHLQALTKLNLLWLGSNDISDAGLPYLKGLSGLKTLSLERTHVTAEGIRELQKSLPATTIVWQ